MKKKLILTAMTLLFMLSCHKSTPLTQGGTISPKRVMGRERIFR